MLDRDVLKGNQDGGDNRPYWAVTEPDHAALDRLKGEFRKIAAARAKKK
jgi:hypothetical protein